MGEYVVALFAIVIGVCVPFSIPLVFIVLNYRKRRHMMELHHAERMAAIERGIEIPALPLELLEGGSARVRRRRTSLLPGLIWFFVGVALLISMRTLAEQQMLFALVPTGVGLAYLIYYAVEGRKLERELPLESGGKPRDAALS